VGLSADQLRAGLDSLAAAEPALALALADAGYPEPRIRPPGYETLLRTIIGQQVSIKAAASIWNKLEGVIGEIAEPSALLARSEEDLRGAGLSRQKISYARSLAELVVTGALDLSALPAGDEEAIHQLIQIRGIGRWSAEIYLLFAEGRPDVWPAGDLVVQIVTGRIMGLEGKPSEKVTRQLAEPWSPHRGAAAIFMWHHYRHGTQAI
jgi:DNA-3-methyladenine glycosylase II